MLQKGVYPYEYVDKCQKFDETSLLKRKKFYSTMTIEGIMNTD